jgi:Carbohydrate esterase, sialic acid-specific acetylesterase
MINRRSLVEYSSAAFYSATTFSRRFRDNRQSIAYPVGSRPAEAVLVYGQSNAGAGGSIPATYLSADFPNDCVTLRNPYEQMFSVAVDQAAVGQMSSLRSPSYGGKSPLTIAVPTAFALEQFQRDARQTSPQRWWFTVSAGGQPISAFQPGTIAYTNMLLAARSIATTASPLNPSLVPVKAIIWIQGESATPGYAAALTDLVTNLVHDVQSQTGQPVAPLFMILQVNNSSKYANFTQVVLDELTVARTVPGALIAGPMYYTPLQDEHISNIHGTQQGRMMAGEILAVCYQKQVVEQIKWNPLQPSAVSLTGAVITIEFDLPPGSGNLTWDTKWVMGCTNFGFVYRDDSGSATIRAVSLGANGTSVVITLSAVPTGPNKAVLYAMGQPADLSDLWPAARGQLISPTKQESYFFRRDQGVPQYVNHYCVRFAMQVS